MALNPALLARLEASGLTNAALEQLATLLDGGESGSITWHFTAHCLAKFEIRQVGSLRNMHDIDRVTQRFRS